MSEERQEEAQPAERAPQGTRPARIWLTMLRGGGRWSIAELRQELADLGSYSINVSLRSMLKAGTVRHYDKEPFAGGAKRVRFGITPECLVPPGVSMRDLKEAGYTFNAIQETP